MKAIILAGGEGRRLRPLTDKLPGVMVPVMNQPMMVYLLRLLKNHGITDIGVALGYRSDSISDYFKDGESFGVRLTYFQEQDSRGTAGSIKAAADFLTEDFVVLCGNTVTDANLTSALYFHRDRGAMVTMILKESENPHHHDVAVTGTDGRIIHFAHRPDWNQVRSDMVNTGMYIMKPEILSFIPEDVSYDFSLDLFPLLLEKNLPLFGYVSNNYWCDIKDISAYRKCHKDIFLGHVKLGFSEEELSSGVFIGKDCNIADDAVIERYTVVGDNTSIGSGAMIRDSILWNGSSIPEHADLYRTVTCGSQMVYAPPEVMKESLPGGEKHYFSGIINDDITPEFLIQLSLAFSESLRPGSKILLSLSDKSQYMMLKFALLSGLIAGGAEAYNLVGSGDRSIARFALRKLSLDGGIHVQIRGQKIMIELFSADGTPADKTLMNTLRTRLQAGDFTRCDPSHFRPPINVNDIPLYYFKDLVLTTPCKRLNFKIGICTPTQEAKNHVKKICSAFGITALFTNDSERLPDFITENKLNLGLLVGENGKCALYDESGKVLSGDMYYGLVTLITLSAVEGGKVLMPQHASGIVEEIAEKCGGSVERTADERLEIQLLKSNTPAARLQHDLCFDPIRGLIRVCEFLYLNNCSLAHVHSLLPVMHKISRKVDCPPSKKGYVMRKILTMLGDSKTVDMTDGIKLTDDHGWILIMPDYRKNRIHILSESHDEEYACELAGDICKAVEDLTKK